MGRASAEQRAGQWDGASSRGAGAAAACDGAAGAAADRRTVGRASAEQRAGAKPQFWRAWARRGAERRADGWAWCCFCNGAAARGVWGAGAGGRVCTAGGSRDAAGVAAQALQGAAHL